MEDWSELVSIDMLVRRVTVESYIVDQLAEMGASKHRDDMKTRTECIKRELLARAESNDEWWEWLRGTEPLMQSGGIALVRNGEIVWAHQAWIS